MSDDLVKRLRDADQHSQQRILGSRIFGEAADRITALEAENERLRNEYIKNGESYVVSNLRSIADEHAARRRYDRRFVSCMGAVGP